MLIEIEQNAFELTAVHACIHLETLPYFYDVDGVVFLAKLGELDGSQNLGLQPLLIQLKVTTEAGQRDRPSQEREVAGVVSLLLTASLAHFLLRIRLRCFNFTELTNLFVNGKEK